MQFKLTLLGTNSASPAYDRFTSAQVLELEAKSYLIDCGEGAQIRMKQFGIKKSKIDQAFISHLHGDHINGFIGFLTSLGLNDRTKPLDVFAPNGLEKLLDAYNSLVGSTLPFPCRFHNLDTEQHRLIFEDQYLEVFSIPLLHRVPTSGFLFREKQKPRNIKGEKIREYQIPYPDIPAIKAGEDWFDSRGRRIPNAELTTDPPRQRSFAYCSDTAYTESIIPIIEGVDLLYHESTYCEDGASLAKERGHSTAREEAIIAKKAKVGKLVLGHYSSRYKTPDQFEQEAKAVFPNSVAGADGMVVEVVSRKSISRKS